MEKDGFPTTRRVLLATGARAVGGLVLGVVIGRSGRPATAQADAATPVSPDGGAVDGAFVPNAWLRIAPDGSVTVRLHKAEMGQGVSTALPTIVAEELDADWASVATEYAYGDPVYGSPLNGGLHLTFGSTSVRESWEPLRLAGATARAMLIEAAARQWGVAAAACRTEVGAVVHIPTGRRSGYGALAAAASRLSVPRDVPLKDPATFRLIGSSVPRRDVPAKVDGSAVFAFDVREPGMLTATVLRPPTFGGAVRAFDPAAALAIPGVRDVVEIPAALPGVDGGLAVVADGFWPAKLGRDALVVEWEGGPNAMADSAAIRDGMRTLLGQPGAVWRSEGDVAATLGEAARVLEVEYETPFLAHATMEPMSCAADVRPDGADVWVGHQSATVVQELVAAAITGLPPEAVTIHQTFLGCGLGRRGEADFVADAVLVAQAVGAPVKVVRTRDEDFRRDFYRPFTVQRVRAALDDGGGIAAWDHRTVGDSQVAVRYPFLLAQGAAGDPIDDNAVQGLDADFPYAIPHLRVEVTAAASGVPVGWWRGVGHSQNIFVVESVVDELAALAGEDPYAFRRRLLAGNARALAALDLAAERAGWGDPLPPGRGRGIALCRHSETWVAEVAAVAVDRDGALTVERVVCAVDCGIVVNPDGAEAQAVGAAIHGLSGILYGEITIANGGATQANFDDYPLPRFGEIPPIDIHFVPSQEPPGGMGEPTVAPVAPAVANAVFAATGRRLRRLPIRPGDLAAE
jgi:isoquinoline 1-oxidoreductase beta subunit